MAAVDALPRQDLASMAEALVSLTELRARMSVKEKELLLVPLTLPCSPRARASSEAMARSSAFCAVATFFVAAAWVFVKVATGFRTPRFTLFLAAALRGPFFAAGFFGTLAISISNLGAILSYAVTNSESISAP